MSKFNQNVGKTEVNVGEEIRAELAKHPDITTNYEGALAFKLDPLTELYLKAASTLVGEPKFYTSAKDSDNDLIRSVKVVAKIDPEFILQLALYCRSQLHLRSVPLMLIAEFANNEYCIGKVPNARRYVSATIQRADELTELVAYQLARNKIFPRNKTKLPMLIRFGVNIGFPEFDGYQLAKYDNQQKAVKMRDSLFLTHPNPSCVGKIQSTTFQKLADKVLESPETWEVMRSTGKMTWHDVINKIFYKNGRVNNYMAILRNLRNCLQDNSVTAEDIMLLCKMISDKNTVKYSKQLPFRFLSAYKELLSAAGTDISGRRSYFGRILRSRDDTDTKLTPVGMLYITNILDALEKAVSYSADNFPKLSGTSTVIACDVSGSMEKEISKNSSVERFDIGIMLGMIANRFAGNTITGMFGDTWKVLPMSKTDGILKNTMEMHRREGEVGYSTNGYKVLDYLLDNDIAVDRIFIFTDAQMWDSMRDRRRRSIFGDDYDDEEVSFAEKFLKYQKRHPGVKLYTFDLSGYGNIMIPQDTRGVCIIGGWSDKIFDFIYCFENIQESSNTVIDEIKNIRP